MDISDDQDLKEVVAMLIVYDIKDHNFVFDDISDPSLVILTVSFHIKASVL